MRIWDDGVINYDWDSRYDVWDYGPSFVQGDVAAVDGFFDQCLRISPQLISNRDTFLRKNLPTSYSRLITGFRFKCDHLPAVGYRTIAAWWDNTATVQTALALTASGALVLWRDNAYTSGLQIGNTSNPDLIKPNTTVYIELDEAYATSGAAFNLRVNSQSVFPGTGLQTANNASGVAMFSIHCGDANGDNGESHFFRDIYINDTTAGDGHTTFDGDQVAMKFMPAAPGQYTQWSIGGSAPAATNWQSVNEVPANGDITYVSAATVGLKDTYKVGALPANVVQIVSVSTLPDVKTDDAGLGAGATIRPLIGNGTTTAHGADQSVNTTYASKYQAFGQNPLTNAPWELADWNNIEVGVERTA